MIVNQHKFSGRFYFLRFYQKKEKYIHVRKKLNKVNNLDFEFLMIGDLLFFPSSPPEIKRARVSGLVEV